MRWILVVLIGIVFLSQTVIKTNTSPLEQYLNDKSDCQLPCLFGIMPGVTTLDEAERIIQASDVLFSDETGLWFEIENTRISVSLSQDPRQNYISIIILNPYHLQHILTLDTLMSNIQLPVRFID